MSFSPSLLYSTEPSSHIISPPLLPAAWGPGSCSHVFFKIGPPCSHPWFSKTFSILKPFPTVTFRQKSIWRWREGSHHACSACGEQMLGRDCRKEGYLPWCSCLCPLSFAAVAATFEATLGDAGMFWLPQDPYFSLVAICPLHSLLFSLLSWIFDFSSSLPQIFFIKSKYPAVPPTPWWETFDFDRDRLVPSA